MRITLTQCEARHYLLFQYSFNPDLTIKVKQLPNPRWLPEQAGWGVPYSPFAVWLTLRLFPDRTCYDPETYARLVAAKPAHRISFHPTAFPFQLEGAEFLAQGNRLLHDCPGAGKSRQAVLAATCPAVIVCPAAVVYHWRDEIHALFRDRTVAVVRSRDPFPQADYLIISPTLLRRRWRDVLAHRTETLIVDEIHEYRNPRSLQSRALMAIATRTPHVIGLTGTLIYNQLSDLFPALVAIKQFRIHDEKYFLARYCGGRSAVRTKRQRTTQRLTNGDEIRDFLATCALRRSRTQTGRVLPPCTHKVISVPLQNPSVYQQVRGDVAQWLLYNTAAPAESKLMQCNKLRRLGALGKVPAALAYARTLNNRGEKLVIACSFLEPLRLLQQALPQAIRIDGGLTQHKRHALVEYFQRTHSAVTALCSIKATGIGVTLTAARHMLILDLPWCPAELEQVEARIYRQTQTRPVEIAYLLAPETVDKDMYPVLAKKADWSERLWKGGDFPFALTLAAVASGLRSGSTAASSTLPIAA